MSRRCDEPIDPEMERRALALLAATLTAAALAGGAAGGTGSPGWPALRTAGPFVVAEIRAKADGRWGRAWDSLYPPHRAVVARSTYVRCERTTPLELPLDTFHVVRVRRTRVTVPGGAQPVAGVAVTIEAEFRWFGPRDPIVVAHTFHLVPVAGRWTWLLSPSRYRLYLHDSCGGAGPAA